MGTKQKEEMSIKTQKFQKLPLLPLRDVVIFPHMVFPLVIGRAASINAITDSINTNKHVFLVTQKDEKTENPEADDLYKIGTIASVVQILKLPDGTIKILVEGYKRAKIKEFIKEHNYTSVVLEELKLTIPHAKTIEIKAMIRLLLNAFEKYVKLSKRIPYEILAVLEKIDDIERFSDVIISNLAIQIEDKQKLLENSDSVARIEKLLTLIQAENDILDIEQKIHGRIRKQMEDHQREYYLNEQMKSIQKELGDIDSNEIAELKTKIKNSKMSRDANEKANSELKKLQKMSPQSSDAAVIRNYIENLCNVPWYKKTRTNKNIAKAETILNNDHYGLDKVKERILEHLAVQSRVSNNKANILCLVGPPGVGKTSLGESIARAVNRKYIRMALGGVRDEAEIRGHRRTYIGAMPGTIMQKMQKVKVKNPLFLLDEVDKMSMDFRGDPSSALLEVLDPEQNNVFNDHYIEVDYDLSQVMFLATANTLNIPHALLDRMEIIQLPGYTEGEKLEIAKQYLIAKQFKNNGLKETEIGFKDSAILEIIRYYTREAGVRNLDREISKICRKVVKNILLKKQNKKIIINDKNIGKYLGVRKYRFGIVEDRNQIGEVCGLAWTEVGGDLLTIEATANRGKGKLIYTGQLGDVMQESIQAAMSVIRSRAKELKIKDNFYEKLDIHIHVPDGATPKDGPSAGAAMCTAISSVLTNRKVKANVAMTGEITLRGEITPIGGLKEKLLAALRGGIKTVIIPEENAKELSEIPENIVKKLKIKKVRWIDEVFKIALENKSQTQ